MAWFIRDVPYYRAFNKAGRVVNPHSGETRLFPSYDAAITYAQLSHFNRPQVEKFK